MTGKPPERSDGVNKFAHGHADNFALSLLCELARLHLSGLRIL